VAWSHLQATGANSAGGTSIATTFTTANLSSGSKLIALVGVGSGSSLTPGCTGVSDGTNNFTQIASNTSNAGGVGFYLGLWVLDTPAGDVGTKPTITATVTGAATSAGLGIVVQEVSGLAAGTSCLDGTAAFANAANVSGTTSGPAYTSAAANEYLVEVFNDDGGNGLTNPSGYTTDGDGIPNTNEQVAVAYKNSTGGSETASWVAAAVQANLMAVAFLLPGVAAADSLPPARSPAFNLQGPPFRPVVTWGDQTLPAPAGPPLWAPTVQAAAPGPPFPVSTVGFAPPAGIPPYWWPIVVGNLSGGFYPQTPPPPPPPVTAQVLWAPRPGVSPYWWPIYVQSAGPAQPPPSVTATPGPPPGTSPYWWPLYIQAATVGQPPPAAQTFVALQPGAAAAAVVMGWPVQSAAFPQPPPSGRVGWAPPPGVSPYWWPLYVQSAGPGQPPPAAQTFVGLQPGAAAPAVVMGWPVQSAGFPQPPAAAQILRAPPPGIAPYWWPLYVQSAGYPQPALNPPGVVVVGLTPGIGPGAIIMGWPVQSSSFPQPAPAGLIRPGLLPVAPVLGQQITGLAGITQPPPLAQVLWSPRPGTSPYWWPILIRSAAPGQARPAAQILVFAIIPPPPPPFTIGQVAGVTENLAGLAGQASGLHLVVSRDQLEAILAGLTEQLGRLYGHDEEA
jgi:hypothetical protein